MEETFGEDTYLSSRMAYAIVTGEQGEDISRPDKVVCEPKHYCVHGMAEGGTNCSPARAGVREVETGRFGADMRVSMEGDGPVTILLDTAEWARK